MLQLLEEDLTKFKVFKVVEKFPYKVGKYISTTKKIIQFAIANHLLLRRRCRYLKTTYNWEQIDN